MFIFLINDYYYKIFGKLKKMKKIIFAIMIISVALIGMSFVSAAELGNSRDGCKVCSIFTIGHSYDNGPIIPSGEFSDSYPYHYNPPGYHDIVK